MSHRRQRPDLVLPFAPPAADCPLCPRLVEFRQANRAANPDWHNAPVPSFGGLDARILLVGLAPGLKGANRTGRPFTGDYAGDLLYATLKSFGLAEGDYRASADDGFTLVGARVTNAVRCVPPANKPLPAEFAACRPFLTAEMAAMPNLAGLFAIGRNAHEALMSVLGLRKADYPFAHGALHRLPTGLVLADSYHCSRYNTNTGRLTEAMFRQAMQTLVDAIP
ncbi:MAG: uracil-DNA glycosylase [Solirubrobacterales bacterium]